jgi:hypothetical protein
MEENTLENYFLIVEDAIKMLEVEPETTRGNEAGQWNLLTGELEVWVDVMPAPETNVHYFQVMTPFCQIPPENADSFMLEILKRNYQMIDSSFTIFNGGIYLRCIKDMIYLDAEQCFVAINRIGYYAIEYKKALKELYQLIPIVLEEDSKH